jgi:hypothetical protein
MGQITPGSVYTSTAPGNQVTADNLNDLVGKAEITHEVINGQQAASPVLSTDNVLIASGSTLKKATVSQISGNLNTSNFVRTDVPTTVSADIQTLVTAPPSALSLTCRQYVDSKVFNLAYSPVNKAGDSMTGNLSMTSGAIIVLPTIGAAPESAVNRTYVSQQISGLATTAQLNTHVTDTSNPHQVNKAQVQLGNVDNTSDLAKPISTAQQAALDLKLNLSGGTLTGALGLATAAIDVNTPQYQAVYKKYVDDQDAQFLSKVATTSQSVLGPVNFASSAILSLTPAVQTAATSAITKTQLDAVTILSPRIVASGWFSTSTPASNVLSTVNFLNVLVTRANATTTLEVNYNGLGSIYKNTARPFFLDGGYVCFQAATGITAGLYKITANFTSLGVFNCEPMFTGALSSALSGAAGVLSCVVKNPEANDASLGNVKSVYVDLAATSKYYVNYINDTITGSSTNMNPTVVNTAVAMGNAASNATAGGCYVMRDVGRAFPSANVSLNNNQEGVGATSMGCHIGFFNYGTLGVNQNYLYQAGFAIAQR